MEQTEFECVPGPVGKGCYLTFEYPADGMLFMQWSATPVAGAIAFFAPTKAVPEFKYKQNGGKNELVRGFRGPTRSRFYEGWCSYMKLARDCAGDVVLLTISYVSLWVRQSTGDVVMCPPGKPVSLANATAVAAVGDKDEYYFLGVGVKQGSSLSLL